MQKGDFVKISRNAERFWVRLIEEYSSGDKIEGIIDNDVDPKNGKAGDCISFYSDEIIDYLPKPTVN